MSIDFHCYDCGSNIRVFVGDGEILVRRCDCQDERIKEDGYQKGYTNGHNDGYDKGYKKSCNNEDEVKEKEEV